MTDGIRHMAWQEGFKAQEPNLVETADFFHKAKEGYEKELTRLQSENDRLKETNGEYASEILRLTKRCNDLSILDMSKLNEITALRSSLGELVEMGDEFIKEAGGCDHSVGICYCNETNRITKAEQLLNKTI